MIFILFSPSLSLLPSPSLPLCVLVSTCISRSQEKVMKPPELELQVGVSHQMVLGTELRSSAGAASALKH